MGGRRHNLTYYTKEIYSNHHHHHVITFTQSSNNYIPNSNHVSRVYNVAAILWLQFTVHVMQFPMINILYFSIVIIIIITTTTTTITTIIIHVTTFMQAIYNYIPDINFTWEMFCTFTLALPAVCVQYPIWLFFVLP